MESSCICFLGRKGVARLCHPAPGPCGPALGVQRGMKDALRAGALADVLQARKCQAKHGDAAALFAGTSTQPTNFWPLACIYLTSVNFQPLEVGSSQELPAVAGWGQQGAAEARLLQRGSGAVHSYTQYRNPKPSGIQILRLPNPDFQPAVSRS